MRDFKCLGKRIGTIVAEKNAAYGDSAGTSAEALKLLYPNGVPVDAYTDALLIVRVWDKLKRISTRKQAFGESPWQDIAGYGIIGTAVDEESIGKGWAKAVTKK